ncbi:MAG: class I SAM-dependent methyltransferase [Sedimentisphaerales bacterium]|nr:class I SAM-dependent methyltransferase [Sedimentisphaerales bacterium]
MDAYMRPPRTKSLRLTACAAVGVALLAAASCAVRPTTIEPSDAMKAETRILGVLEDMYRQEYGMWNVTREDGRLLRILAETSGAKHIVEIGTSDGCSALWFCLALQTTAGRLITHEIDDYRASLARENFQRAGVDHLVTIVEGDAHKTVTNIKGKIDILFLHADKTGNLDYLNKLLPLVRPGGLIIAHSTTANSQDMKDYLDAVTTDPNLVTTFLRETDKGIGLTLKKPASTR